MFSYGHPASGVLNEYGESELAVTPMHMFSFGQVMGSLIAMDRNKSAGASSPSFVARCRDIIAWIFKCLAGAERHHWHRIPERTLPLDKRPYIRIPTMWYWYN
jgi:hypothetical protein